MGRLRQRELPEDNGFMTLAPSQKTKTLSRSVIAECPVQNSEMTCNDKLNLCKSGTRVPKSSKTSGLGLTSKGKGLTPYWNELCQEASSHLWLPTETVLQDSDSSCSGLLLNAMVEKSWFATRLHTAPKKNSLEICSPYCTSFPAGCTDYGSTKLKSRLTRIYPTAAQRKTLRQWYGVSRYVFNKTVEYLNTPDTKANWMVIKKWLLKELPEWADNVPYQVKAIAVQDACSAVKMCKRKFGQSGQINKVSFRSRKAPAQSIFIPKSAIKDKSVYVRALGELRFSEVIKANHDCRLIFRQGRWFLSVPVEATQHLGDNQARVVALDPGVRTFQTFYSPESCGKIGCAGFSRIMRLCHYLDNLLSRMAKATSSQRRRMRKAVNRMRWRVRDLVKELHNKAALFFVKNFDIILIPSFETSGMVVKKARKLRSKTVRAMLSFAHYRFRQHLEFKAWEYGKRVVVVNEAYTSKTCSWSGTMKIIGSAKFIRENEIVVDRDYNGARGILLRALVDLPSHFKMGAFVSVN